MATADSRSFTTQEQNADSTRGDERGVSIGSVPGSARLFSLRGFTSILLVIALLVVLVSGVMLYVAPRGRTANVIDWSILSLGRSHWVALHINASLLFLVASVTHICMNLSRLVGYLKKRSRPGINMKWELATAVIVSTMIFAATILEIAPIDSLVDLKYQIRDTWELNQEP